MTLFLIPLYPISTFISHFPPYFFLSLFPLPLFSTSKHFFTFRIQLYYLFLLFLTLFLILSTQYLPLSHISLPQFFSPTYFYPFHSLPQSVYLSHLHTLCCIRYTFNFNTVVSFQLILFPTPSRKISFLPKVTFFFLFIFITRSLCSLCLKFFSLAVRFYLLWKQLHLRLYILLRFFFFFLHINFFISPFY